MGMAETAARIPHSESIYRGLGASRSSAVTSTAAERTRKLNSEISTLNHEKCHQV